MKRIWLRTRRRELKLTQAALARRIGKPQSFISKLENGEKTSATFDEVVALAKALEIEPTQLRFGGRHGRDEASV